MKQSFPVAAGNIKQRNSIVFWLLCVLICYQAGYQVYMSFILGQDSTALDPWCNGAQGSAQHCVEAHLFQGWQTAGPESEELLKIGQRSNLEPLSTTPGASAAAATQDNIPIPRPDIKAEHTSLAQSNSSAALSISALFATADNNTNSAADNNTKFWSMGLIALQKRFEERSKKVQLKRQERRAEAAHSTIKEWQNMSTLSRDLNALHEHFGKRLADRRAHTDSAKAEFGNLSNWAHDVESLQKHFEKEFIPHSDHRMADVASIATTQDNMTDWSHGLEELQHRLAARMEVHNKAHHHIDELDASIEAHKKAHHTLEAKTHEPALLDQIAALGKQMCSDAKHRDNPKCTRFLGAGAEPPRPSVASAANHWHPPSDHFLSNKKSLDEAEAAFNSDLHQLAEKQHTWEKSFMAKIDDTMQDFCSDPFHKEQHSCKEFLHNHEVAKKKAWHEKFKSKIANVGSELCNNPMRKDYLICKKMFAVDNTAATDSSSAEFQPAAIVEQDDAEDDAHVTSPTHSMHERIDLHWSTVVERQNQPSSSSLRGSAASAASLSASTIDPAQVSSLRRSAHWSGRIPTVACIALVPRGPSAKAYMHYFIDNFRLQSYEGGHHLVLVYHHDDNQAAELVHKYADGTYILSATARGSDFPSAAAFRFGAWIGRDADVVARWDFEAWHHPHRLSMQVRALAFSGRPASLLDRWTMVDKAGANTTVQHGDRWDSSIVGEAGWMRKNWYPQMGEEESAFNDHAARDVVRLDGAELEVFDESHV